MNNQRQKCKTNKKLLFLKLRKILQYWEILGDRFWHRIINTSHITSEGRQRKHENICQITFRPVKVPIGMQ